MFQHITLSILEAIHFQKYHKLLRRVKTEVKQSASIIQLRLAKEEVKKIGANTYSEDTIKDVNNLIQAIDTRIEVLKLKKQVRRTYAINRHV